MFAFVKRWAVGMAADFVKEHATVDQLAAITADAADTVLVKVLAKTDAEKLAKICKTCKGVADVCGKVAAAIEDGTVTGEEATEIIQEIMTLFKTSPLTDEAIAACVDRIAESIKAKID